MDMITPHDDIDRGMHLDAGDLGAAKLHHVIDVMNVIVLDNAEDTTHTSNDSALLTVVNIVAADNVAPYFFLQPSVILAAAYRIALHLCGALHMFCRKEMVVCRITIFAERNTGALAAPDLAVLYYPAFGPVRAYHSILICGRQTAGRRGLVDIETADRDVTDSRSAEA